MARFEHLQLIQGAITRMASHQFLIKGWTVTLVAGLTALSAANNDRSFAWIAVCVVVVFALLDAFYLAIERAYRNLYDDVVAGRAEMWSLTTMSVGPGQVLGGLTGFSVWPLHGVAFAGALAVAIIG